MKKIYTAPQANLLCFESQENLANVDDIFDSLIDPSNPNYQGGADGDIGGISGVIKT